MRKKRKEWPLFLLIGLIVCFSFVTKKFLPSEKPLDRDFVAITEEKQKDTLSVQNLNQVCYTECIDDIMACVALVEDYHEKPYFCGKKWTIGYGSTFLSDGSPVTAKTKPITKEKAKECVLVHLNERVLPYVLKYIDRALSHEEMISTCLFIYNIGGENFSGYSQNGKKIKNESCFLLAINNNDPPKKIAEKLTGFRSSNGKQANGLLKRRWIEGAIFLGLLPVERIWDMQPGCFYHEKVSFFYKKLTTSKNGFYEYDFRPQTLEKFILKSCFNAKTTVRDIL